MPVDAEFALYLGAALFSALMIAGGIAIVTGIRTLVRRWRLHD